MSSRITVLTIALIALFIISCNEKGGDEYRPPAFPKGQGSELPSAPAAPTNIIPPRGNNEIDMLKELVKKDPGNIEAWIRIGNIAMDSERFQEAVDAYGKALEIEPGNADVRVDMGTCYRRLGDPVRAIEEYKKALTYNPNHLYAHKNMGVVLAFDLHKEEEAINAFQTYLKLSPNAPDALQVSDVINDLKRRTGKGN